MAWYLSKKKEEGGGGTTVVANPVGTATAALNKLQVGTDIYSIPSGGGGGSVIVPGYSTSEQPYCAWTDGTTVYSKTFSIPGDGVTRSFTQQTGITNGKKLINAQIAGLRYDDAKRWWSPLNINLQDNTWHTQFNMADDFSEFIVGAAQYPIKDITVTLYYTKTDDVPFSGGSGGHNIVNDAGTSLAQEPNLQFKGTYIHDDSTNNASVVEVSRSMTKEQFEALSEEAKLGVVEILDEEDVPYCYDIEGVLKAGDSKITFSHDIINKDSTIDVYTDDINVSPVKMTVTESQSQEVELLNTVTIVTSSTGGSSAALTISLLDGEGTQISSETILYSSVSGGESNAYVIEDLLKVWYDSSVYRWVVKTLSRCTYNNIVYEAGFIIDMWGYGTSRNTQVDYYSVAGGYVTLTFPVQDHNVGVKIRITGKDCGPIDIAPHIVDYSTEEQNTGVKWIDGSYIYQKTINTGALQNGANMFAVSGLDIDKVIEIQGFGYSNDAQYCIPYLMGNFDYIITACYFPTTHQIRIEKGTSLSAIVDSWVTIKYTKSS